MKCKKLDHAGGGRMWRLVYGAALMAIAALAIASMPDVKRYMRMRAM